MANDIERDSDGLTTAQRRRYDENSRRRQEKGLNALSPEAWMALRKKGRKHDDGTCPACGGYHVEAAPDWAWDEDGICDCEDSQ